MLLFLLGCTEDPSPPDIVLVVIDTLRADHVGAYGAARQTTPNLDAIAEQGLLFDRAYAHSGWTLPSFASLLTGLHPHDHKVGRDAVRTAEFGRLDEGVQTLAELAAAAGYRTGAFVNNSYLAREFGFHEGFEVYDWVGADGGNHRSANDTVAQSQSWLSHTDPRPSFALVHFMEPHLQYGLDPAHRGKFSGANPGVPTPFGPDEMWVPWMNGSNPPSDAVKAAVQDLYDEDVFVADLAIGELFEGLPPDTLLVVTADHGEEFWDHGRFEHGHTVFGELTRVPLVIKGPDISPKRVSTPVGHTDLFQGLIRQMGLTGVPGTAGDDLFAIAQAEPFDRGVISENTAYGPPQMSLATREHRVVLRPTMRTAEVWEISADGSETERLAPDQQQATAQRLLGALKGLRGSLEATEIRGVRIPNPTVFQQLQSLGYIDDSPDPVPAGLSPGLLNPEMAKDTAPARFRVRFETTRGAFVAQVHRDWSPHGADRFYNLVKHGFYDGSAFFRVVDGFVAQAGISAIPAVNVTWQNRGIPDDPVKTKNTKGTLAFAQAGPNTRSTQFFVNLGDNLALDEQGFAPFARIIEGTEIAQSLFSKYGEMAPLGSGPDPRILAEEGGRYIQHIYPGIDVVLKATVVP